MPEDDPNYQNEEEYWRERDEADAQAMGAKTPDHTPGPWECMEKGQMYAGAGYYLVMAPGQDYITLAKIPAPIHSIPHSKTVAKANARLISAAPDLLALVIRTSRLMNSMEEPGTKAEKQRILEEWERIGAESVDVIAKATKGE